MKPMKKIFFLFIALGFAVSCTKNFEEYNTDTKNPASVTPATLFASSQKSMFDVITSTNVNNNVFRLFAQYWTETTYIDEANYDLTTRNIPQNFWNTIYVGVLKNLDESKRLIPGQDATFFPAAVQKNQTACVEIMTVYGYSVLVNTFGNVPYSQALDINTIRPKYDDAKTIYIDLLKRLDAAIALINTGADGFGSSDLLNGGDMTQWVKFANALKMRLGMILAEVDEATGKAAFLAGAANTITSNDENIVMHYLTSPPNTNPIWVDLIQSGRKDFVAANTIVDIMNNLGDPRVPLYFTVDANGGYSGGIYADNNNYATYSKPADRITKADYESIIIDLSEIEFLLAEAAAKGWSVTGTAESHYNAAIKASMEYWGASSTDADAYLAKPEVAYSSAAGDFRTKIGNQKWIALYNRGFEGWTEWRRLDAPTLNVPTDLTYADIPKRYTYSVQEQNLNKANYDAAATAIGGDAKTTKLFWDIR